MPSTASFAQQAALAFHERDALAAFATAFVYDPDGALARMVKMLPDALRRRVDPQLQRRAISALPRDVIVQHAFWEVVRTIAAQSGAPSPIVDRIWDRQSRAFTRTVGREVSRGGVGAVYAYEYTALETFQAARRCAVARILDFSSLNSRQFEALQRNEKQRFPELRGPHDAYFERKLEARQARRDTEMHLADVIITNSTVTRRSHIEGGADPDKTFAVPYGAPPPLARPPERSCAGPMGVVWAGTFSIRKGAHYLVDAWRRLASGVDAHLDVFGAVAVPERLWKPAPPGITFHGSVVRPTLFRAFDEADVLIFPTLSDGFGMVVTEAFARGLPVITTDQAGASDLVRHGQNGLIVRAGDPAAIAGALAWCLDNRDALSAMRAVALETARSWQWSDYRKALIDAVALGMQRAGYGPQVLAKALEAG